MSARYPPIARVTARADQRRFWLAAGIAPWAPAVVLAGLSAADAIWRGDFAGLHGWPATLATLVLTLAVSFSTMLALGLPALLWLRARGRLRGTCVCLASVLAAGIALLAAALAGWPLSAWGDLVGLACGGLAGVVFCVVASVPWRIGMASSGGSARPPSASR